MRLINLTTFTTPTSAMADLELVFRPQTDLAMWNYIAREILARKAVDEGFVERHCVSAAGHADIGYALRDQDPLEQPHTHRKQAGQHWLISQEDVRKGGEPYTLDYVARLAKGDPSESVDAFNAGVTEFGGDRSPPPRSGS